VLARNTLQRFGGGGRNGEMRRKGERRRG